MTNDESESNSSMMGLEFDSEEMFNEDSASFLLGKAERTNNSRHQPKAKEEEIPTTYCGLLRENNDFRGFLVSYIVTNGGE